MRELARIPRILAKLHKVWDKYPDMRLGQLLMNLEIRDTVYYIEDDVWETKLDRLLETGEWV